MPAGTIAVWFISSNSTPPPPPPPPPSSFSNALVEDWFLGDISEAPDTPDEPPSFSDALTEDWFLGEILEAPDTPDEPPSFSDALTEDWFLGEILDMGEDSGSGSSGILEDWFLGSIGSNGGSSGGSGSSGGGSGDSGSGGSGSGGIGYTLDFKWVDYIVVNARKYLEAFFRRFTRIRLKIKELYLSGYEAVVIPPSELINHIDVSFDNTSKVLTIKEKMNNPIPDNLKTLDKKYLFYVCIKPTEEDLNSFLARITPLLDPDNPPPEVVLVYRVCIYPDVKPPYR
jgi:hypothetical protein